MFFFTNFFFFFLLFSFGVVCLVEIVSEIVFRAGLLLFWRWEGLVSFWTEIGEWFGLG